MSPLKNQILGTALITMSTLAWSVTGYFTRLVALDSVTLIAWRGLFGAVCLLGVAVLLRGREWTKEFNRFGKLEWLYIANSSVGTVMLFTAFAYTSVAHVAVIFATLPIIAALLGWLWLRESPTASSIVASVAALGGVSLMVAFGGDGHILGDLLALGMTITTTITILLNRRYPSMPVLGCSAASLALTSILFLPFAHYEPVSNLQFTHIALFALINSVFGVALYAFGSRRIPAVEVALISALDAPLAVFLVWLAFDERPGRNTIIGGSVVMGAVMLYILVAARRRQTASA